MALTLRWWQRHAARAVEQVTGTVTDRNERLGTSNVRLRFTRIMKMPKPR